MKERVIAIIQARMSSTRLPGKVLLDLGGRPVLDRMIERVKLAKNCHGNGCGHHNRPIRRCDCGIV